MLSVEKYLGNLFNHQSISRIHLLAYARDHIRRLTASNDHHQYDIIIGYLTLQANAFEAELTKEDTTMNLRKGQTKTVDQVAVFFCATMSEYENEIGRKLGGKSSVGFYEFYPNGLKEYSKPSRDNLEKFVKRISLAATKYSTELGDELTSILLDLQPSYETARNSQTTSIANLNTTKSVIVNNQVLLEKALTKSLHEIGVLFPGDPAACTPLFNFNLLYPNAHHHYEMYAGTIPVNGMVDVLNKTLTDTFTIVLNNPRANAAIWIWLGATATDTNNALAIKVEPGHSKTIKPSDIGDLANTFLLIKNESSVNIASYEVKVIE